MTYKVRIGRIVRDQIHERYAADRSPTGYPSRQDFEDGPLEAARLQFTRFDDLPHYSGASIRHCHVLVPGFAPVVFVGLLVAGDTVEIADFADDPEYWNRINEDPIG